MNTTWYIKFNDYYYSQSGCCSEPEWTVSVFEAETFDSLREAQDEIDALGRNAMRPCWRQLRIMKIVKCNDD